MRQGGHLAQPAVSPMPGNVGARWVGAGEEALVSPRSGAWQQAPVVDGVKPWPGGEARQRRRKMGWELARWAEEDVEAYLAPNGNEYFLDLKEGEVEEDFWQCANCGALCDVYEEHYCGG